MTSFGNFVEIFLQALTAGILLGAIYGLMCVGLGIIFGERQDDPHAARSIGALGTRIGREGQR